MAVCRAGGGLQSKVAQHERGGWILRNSNPVWDLVRGHKGRPFGVSALLPRVDGGCFHFSLLGCSMSETLSITYPWPDYRISANGMKRGNSRLQARLTKTARNSAAKITHDRGLDPVNQAMPCKVISHPPSNRWDKDNAKAISKPILDGIADAMGVNDKSFDADQVVGDPVKGGAIVVLFSEIPAR